MFFDSGNGGTVSARPDWLEDIFKFAHPTLRKSIWQILDTFIPYFALWALMIYIIQKSNSFWLTIIPAIVAAALLVRIFIIFHDCCHRSFFTSQRANQIMGYISGILTFTPYHKWRLSHLRHHATSGDLDRRGSGDVWTMTVDEYVAAPALRRLTYRLYRNPFIMFGLGPVFSFLLINRISNKGAKASERNSVIITNLAILGIIALAGLTIGIGTYLKIQLPVILIAGSMGIWLFYVQHQFEDVYWARHDVWKPTRAALEGSSYYKLPKILQWFTGNIGLHHIHHAQPKIPNYNLQRCYNTMSAMREVKPLTLRKSLKSLRMRLWDEKKQKLAGFTTLKARYYKN